MNLEGEKSLLLEFQAQEIRNALQTFRLTPISFMEERVDMTNLVIKTIQNVNSPKSKRKSENILHNPSTNLNTGRLTSKPSEGIRRSWNEASAIFTDSGDDSPTLMAEDSSTPNKRRRISPNILSEKLFSATVTPDNAKKYANCLTISLQQGSIGPSLELILDEYSKN